MATYKELVGTLKIELKEAHAAWIALKQAGWECFPCTAYIALRSKHIAYSMLKGKTLEQIESKRRDPASWVNKSIDKQAERQLTAWRELILEDTAAWEARKAARVLKCG